MDTSPRDTSPEHDPQLVFRVSWREAWGLLVILAGIAVGYVWQVLGGSEADYLGALSVHAIAMNRWYALVTSMFMHSGLWHLMMNLSALLPFGLILAGRMGASPGGQLRFIAFYLACGLAGAILWLLMWPGQGAMVGASGAVFGLWGGVLRLRRDGGVHPLFSPEIARQLPGPIFANLLITVVFEAAGGLLGVGGIAWQAHVGGFVFGLAAITLFLPRRQAV